MSDVRKIVYEELKDILTFNMNKYSELVKLYGTLVVNSVIEQLIKEDKENLTKFRLYLSGITIHEICTNDLYLADVSRVGCLNNDKNLELMIKINNIIDELDILFEQAGYDDSFLKGVPFVSDKVNYCINHSSDCEILGRLKKLYKEYCINRDLAIEGNLRLVIAVARGYRANDLITFDDIVQYGNMGLMKAIEKYDVTKGVSFSTYAVYWINQYILRNIRNIKYPFKIPEYMVSKYNNLIESINELSFKFGTEPSVNEISKYTGLSVDEVEKLMAIFSESISIDTSCLMYGSEDSQSSSSLLCDSISSDDTLFSDMIIEDDCRKKFIELLKQYLSPREYLVIMLYYGFGGIQYNTLEISEMLNISKQRVSQLNVSSIKKLKLIPNINEMFVY